MSSLDLFGLTFASPWFLLLLLVIPLLSYLQGNIGGAPAVAFSSTTLLQKIGKRRESSKGFFMNSLAYVALASLIVGLARPQQGQTQEVVTTSGIDIILSLDVSGSMLAEDFTLDGQRANRIQAVKRVTRDFLERRTHDRIGLMAFAGRPYLVSPMTLDHAWLLQNLDRIRLGLVEDGTAIGSALAAATNRLRHSDAESRVIILLSDGENNTGRVAPITAAEAAAALGIRIYTIGAGSYGEAPFPFTDRFGRTVYRNVPVDFDEENLIRIAEIGGGRYWRATDTASLQEVYDEIDRLERSEVEVTEFRNYTDLYPWFVAFGFGLLGVQLVLSQTIWRRLP